MAVNVNSTENLCNVSQFNEAQALMDFICPKLCQYFNDYLLLTANVNANPNMTGGNNNLIAVTNQLRSYVNMVVEFFNISQFQAIAYLYQNCTQTGGLSYVPYCKVRPNTSMTWNDILGQAPSTQAGLMVGYLEVLDTSSGGNVIIGSPVNLSNELFLENTNLTIDESLNVRPR